MNEYCKHRNLSRKKVVFSFDGDELNGKETPEELDMEDENVIDVRTKWLIIWKHVGVTTNTKKNSASWSTERETGSVYVNVI